MRNAPSFFAARRVATFLGLARVAVGMERTVFASAVATSRQATMARRFRRCRLPPESLIAHCPKGPILPLVQLDALKLTLTAVFEPAPEGGYTCHFEEFPEIFSEGETMEEARTNLADALKLVTEYHRDEARSRASASAVRESHLMVAS